MAPRATRVLLACDFFLKYTAGLARGLADAGCEATLLSRDHDWEFGGRPGAMAEHAARALDGRVSHLSLPGRVREPAGWQRALELRRGVRHDACDVVHYQDSVVNDPRLPLVGGLPRGRVALTVHDPVGRAEDSMPLHEALLRRALLRRCDLVFVHAEALREQLIGEISRLPPVAVVPHGVDPPAVAPLPPTPTLLAFGRMSRYKGLDVLLDALATVWETAPEVELRIAGEGPLPEHPALSDRRVQVRNEHIPEEDVPSCFAAATCVVLPYREASQSGVGSLAKRHGRAVVASAVGGLPELVGDGSGLLVPPGSPVALAGALLELVRDPGRAQRLGRAGADAIERRFGWPAVARATLDAYERFLPAMAAANSSR